MRSIGPKGMFRLSQGAIRKYLSVFLCDDSDEMGCLDVLSKEHFSPDSFTVADRRSGPPYLNDSERTYDEWCNQLICDQLQRVSSSEQIHLEAIDEMLPLVRENLEMLLQYPLHGGQVQDELWNQEFVDVLNRIIAYSLNGSPNRVVRTHSRFNSLASKLVPLTVEVLQRRNLSLLTWARLSVLSGLSGLDLKGSASASSLLVNRGIPMSSYLELPISRAVRIYTGELEGRLSCPAPVFHWDRLLAQSDGRGAHILWFVDDYIETFFDLVLIGKLLTAFPCLRVTLVGRRETYGVDVSSADIESILHLPQYADLSGHPRLSMCRCGPSMGALNLRKLSRHVTDAICESTCVVIKGCRAHEMVQGGLNKPSFTWQVVARESSESVTGYDASRSPLLLFYLDPGEYAFFGMKKRHLRRRVLPSGRAVFLSTSTLRDHLRRVQTADVPELADELARMRVEADRNPTDAVQKELNLVATRLELLSRPA